MNARERRRLARLVRENAQAVARALRSPGAGANLGDLAACLTLNELTDRAMHQLVADARRSGATWAEIGGVLQTSRQAAQQRFKDMDSVDETVARLQERAFGILAHWREGEGSLVVAHFDETMRERLDQDGLARAWGEVEQMMGAQLAAGTPSTTRRGRYRVVDIPLNFEKGPMKGRVVFDDEDRVAGLFVLTPGAS